jgi:hypothetical protein
MRPRSNVTVHLLDFRPSADRIKGHLKSKGRDDWNHYFPMGRFGYVEVNSVASFQSDYYVLNSEGLGSNQPFGATNPIAIPFHGENGNLLEGTYCFSREPVIQSRYFSNIQDFSTNVGVPLSTFILPDCDENYRLWELFILQISR